MDAPASEAASATAITEAGAVCFLPPLAAAAPAAAFDLPDDGGVGVACGGSGCSRDRLICGGTGVEICCLLAVTASPCAMETTAGGGPSGIAGGMGVVARTAVPPLPLTSTGLPPSAASSVELSGGSS